MEKNDHKIMNVYIQSYNTCNIKQFVRFDIKNITDIIFIVAVCKMNNPLETSQNCNQLNTLHKMLEMTN